MTKDIARLSNGEEVSPLLYQLDKHGGSFWEDAACRTVGDPDAWFIDYWTADPDELWRMKLAMDVCNKCPIKAKCLEVGLTDPEIKWGIWGGLLPGERMLMKTALNRLGPFGRQAVKNAMSMRDKLQKLQDDTEKDRKKNDQKD